MAMDIKTIYMTCFEEIGADGSKAVQTYYAERNAPITRQQFFEKAKWAILVSGVTRKGAETTHKKADEGCSFPEKWESLAQWDDTRFRWFINCMSSGSRGIQKWSAIRLITRWCNELGSDEALQRAVFDGKTIGDELNDEDVVRLRSRKLSFIGPANSQFIVRMMGGEIIKEDRWVKAFLAWQGQSLDELNRELDAAGIRRGLFDTVLWQYCETHIRQTPNLPDHFGAWQS